VTKEADRNVTVEGQNIGLKTNLERVILSTSLLGAVTSFLAGYLLREDSHGWACFDFYKYHWPLINLFSITPWGTAVADYGGISSANNPLLYMIAGLMPLHGDQETYHVITFVAALSTWPLLSWAYYRRYSNHGIGWLWASFGASAILISPTFRSSAFWGTSDWLPFVFCAGTSLLLSRFQDYPATHKAAPIGAFMLAALVTVSACAFYTRQFYAFLPILTAWIVLKSTKTSPFFVLSFFAMAMLPEMFLVYLWRGLNPPPLQGQAAQELAAHFHFHPSLANLWMVGTMIGLFSLPIIVGCIRRSVGDVLPEWWGSRSTVAAFVGLLVFVMALRTTVWPPQGGGIIVKAGLLMGTLGTPFILIASYFGLAATILFSMRSATNALLAGTFLAPLFISPLFLGRPAAQGYLEPSLAVALFLLADTQTSKKVFNKRVLTCNFAFNTLILAIAIGYYQSFSVGVCSTVARTTG
jgi:hypothetical protein